MVFRRSVNAFTNIEKAFSTYCCPYCDNATQLSQDELCEKCQKELNDYSINWIISEIYLFDEEEAEIYMETAKSKNESEGDNIIPQIENK